MRCSSPSPKEHYNTLFLIPSFFVAFLYLCILLAPWLTTENRLLKEHMAQLELAIWKARLDELEGNPMLEVQAKRAKIEI